MLLLDVTIVNVALPEIERELGGEPDGPSVGGGLVRPGPRRPDADGRSLADRLGRKLVFTAGLVGSTTASLLAGFSSDALTLALGRSHLSSR